MGMKNPGAQTQRIARPRQPLKRYKAAASCALVPISHHSRLFPEYEEGRRKKGRLYFYVRLHSLIELTSRDAGESTLRTARLSLNSSGRSRSRISPPRISRHQQALDQWS